MSRGRPGGFAGLNIPHWRSPAGQGGSPEAHRGVNSGAAVIELDMASQREARRGTSKRMTVMVTGHEQRGAGPWRFSQELEEEAGPIATVRRLRNTDISNGR